MTVPVLELVEVSRMHGRGPGAVHALVDVCLTVAAGEFVAVMGPSGSGKSTLLHLAGGLDRADTGAVRVQGHDLTRLSASQRAVLRRRHIGYVFQDLNLLSGLTALENVALPAELDGTGRRAARAGAAAALAELGLAGLAARFPDQLSGGQQQRVAVARALAGPRQLLLADEPTGALDSATGEELMGVLRDRADAGACVVLVTHESRNAAWADRVVFLRDGAMVDTTAPAGVESLLPA